MSLSATGSLRETPHPHSPRDFGSARLASAGFASVTPDIFATPELYAGITPDLVYATPDSIKHLHNRSLEEFHILLLISVFVQNFIRNCCFHMIFVAILNIFDVKLQQVP